MPFDPSIPADNTPLDAAEMRGQLNGLKADIDAAPTAQQMNDAISGAINGTPRNVDGFSQLYITISDPPTQSEVQQFLDSYNNLIIALRRNV
ncbi:MAG: hypothetical protein NT105_23565 [Verrucomicrobia bacterium]|nr:hypothetical protein [Verrucomicrobiota bacterium]